MIDYSKPILNTSVRHHISNILPIIDDPELVSAYLQEKGIPAPIAKTKQGLKARLQCGKWWRRALSRARNRNDEAELILRGRVGRRREKYSSDLAVRRVGQKAAQSADFLQKQSLISDCGDVVSMDQIMRASLANPANCRAEFMVRIRGFEDYAREHGYVGEFATWTCPSSLHRLAGESLNAGYDGTCPKDAQRYLTRQWARARAKLARKNIKIFGFRVAEPHRDGTPHWHLLIFVRPEQRDEFRRIMEYYALQVDGDEPGARQHRFTSIEIDPKRGSAAGYIAKYVSKNLGFEIGDAEHDQDSYGTRVKAWSSTWSIRQFQQIGFPGVTIWRELRRIREKMDDEVLESARAAADEGRWADFIEIQGGVDVKRGEQVIQLVHQSVDQTTGEPKKNRYMELIKVVCGVASLFAQAMTRTKKWVMVSSEVANALLAHEPEHRAAVLGLRTWSTVNNCT